MFRAILSNLLSAQEKSRHLISHSYITRAFVRNCNVTLHIKLLDGKNTHHIIEGIFKSFARTMKAAVSIDPTLGGEIPSSKGVL